MDRDYLIKLTLALYKVTDRLPEEEPIKVALREEAVEILSCGVQIINQELSEQIAQAVKRLQALCEVAKKQNWLDEINFTVLSNGYNNVRDKIKEQPQEIAKESRPAITKRPANYQSSKIRIEDIKKPRHRKMLQVLEKRATAQVRDFKEIFPEISKRTLRRDMDFLLKKGLVVRKGDKNNTEYQLKG